MLDIHFTVRPYNSLSQNTNLIGFLDIYYSYLFITLLLFIYSTDFIDPVAQNVHTEEEKPVTLKCTYDTNNTRVYLYWYRQYPVQTPQFVLYKGARSVSDSHIPDSRFDSNTFETSTELKIKVPTLADTALYYCALRVGSQ